jgi:hypothetical protein
MEKQKTDYETVSRICKFLARKKSVVNDDDDNGS